MKKLLAVTGVILIAYVIGSAAAATDSRGSETLSDAQDAAVYVLCAEENRVVVYRDGSLWLRTDTLVSSLPKRDRVRLETGIIVFSDTELKRLIEDYCS